MIEIEFRIVIIIFLVDCIFLIAMTTTPHSSDVDMSDVDMASPDVTPSIELSRLLDSSTQLINDEQQRCYDRVIHDDVSASSASSPSSKPLTPHPLSLMMLNDRNPQLHALDVAPLLTRTKVIINEQLTLTSI